jgi:hypothetical protein
MVDLRENNAYFNNKRAANSCYVAQVKAGFEWVELIRLDCVEGTITLTDLKFTDSN